MEVTDELLARYKALDERVEALGKKRDELKALTAEVMREHAACMREIMQIREGVEGKGR